MSEFPLIEAFVEIDTLVNWTEQDFSLFQSTQSKYNTGLLWVQMYIDQFEDSKCGPCTWLVTIQLTMIYQLYWSFLKVPLQRTSSNKLCSIYCVTLFITWFIGQQVIYALEPSNNFKLRNMVFQASTLHWPIHFMWEHIQFGSIYKILFFGV